jgi:hypothetical protein
MCLIASGGALWLGAPPAQALEVNGARTTDVVYDGKSCGSRDEESLTLPRRAHGIRVVEPDVGDDLEDAEGRPVAEVTYVHKRSRRVSVTVRGAHDVCDFPGDYLDGWATSFAQITADYKVDVSVIVFSCGNGRIRPRQIVLTCGDGAYRLVGMHWRRWGARAVEGDGYAYANDCVPYCAAGHFHKTPARVRLLRPRLCARNKRWNYTRAYVRERGKRRTKWNLGTGCKLAEPAGRIPAA